MKLVVIALFSFLSVSAHSAGPRKPASVPSNGAVQIKIKKRIDFNCDVHACGASATAEKAVTESAQHVCDTLVAFGETEGKKGKLKVTKSEFGDVRAKTDDDSGYVYAVDVDFVATCTE